MPIPLGIKSSGDKGKIFWLDIPPNTPDAKTAVFALGKQGVGKTNILMLLVYFFHKLFIETKAQYGCIPVVFAPFWEWANLNTKTDLDKLEEKIKKRPRLPPDVDAEAMDAKIFSFKMANIPEHFESNVTAIAIDFNQLTTEDIGVFAGKQENEEALGKIEKLLERIHKNHGKVTIDLFLSAVNPQASDDGKEPNVPSLYDGLYYTFKRLKEAGLFTDGAKKFDWFEVLQDKKPVVFCFGDINDSLILQALAGFFMRSLFDLSIEYNNAVDKDKKGMALSERERWLAENFVIGLLFEEAHRFFPPTTVKVLKSFPAHDIFRMISAQLGRKKGFKYTILISQRREFIYKEFRSEFDWLLLGSKIDFSDKEDIYRMVKKIIPDPDLAAEFTVAICKNSRFEWSLTDVNKLTNLEKGCAVRLKTFVAPCGQ